MVWLGSEPSSPDIRSARLTIELGREAVQWRAQGMSTFVPLWMNCPEESLAMTM